MLKPRKLVGEAIEWAELSVNLAVTASRIAVRETVGNIKDAVVGTDPIFEDPITAVLARIDRTIAEEEQLSRLWKGYVTREIAIATKGVKVASREMLKYSTLLAALEGKTDSQRQKYLAQTQQKVPEKDEIARVFAMPRASVVHSADVVARGLMQRPEILFQTNAQDVADFMVLASSVLPDETPSRLRLAPDRLRALEGAIYGQTEAWGPLAEPAPVLPSIEIPVVPGNPYG